MTKHLDLASAVIQAAKAKSLMLSSAESCTGGMIAAALTDIPGSSAVFDRGFITYSYPSKTRMLDVPAEMLAEFGAVSEPVARQMALGALANSDAHISVAVTGVAGPGADGEKPEGLVWFGVATKRTVDAFSNNYGPIGRDNVRHETVKTALKELALYIDRY